MIRIEDLQAPRTGPEIVMALIAIAVWTHVLVTLITI